MNKQHKVKLGYRILALVLAVLMAVPIQELPALAAPADAGYVEPLKTPDSSNEEGSPEYSDDDDYSHSHTYTDGVCECGAVDPDYESGSEGESGSGVPGDPTPEDGLENEEETIHTFWYLNNGDGTHTATCGDDDCTFEEIVEHDFVDGVCVCGAKSDDEDILENKLGELPDGISFTKPVVGYVGSITSGAYEYDTLEDALDAALNVNGVLNEGAFFERKPITILINSDDMSVSWNSGRGITLIEVDGNTLPVNIDLNGHDLKLNGSNLNAGVNINGVRFSNSAYDAGDGSTHSQLIIDNSQKSYVEFMGERINNPADSVYPILDNVDIVSTNPDLHVFFSDTYGDNSVTRAVNGNIDVAGSVQFHKGTWETKDIKAGSFQPAAAQMSGNNSVTFYPANVHVKGNVTTTNASGGNSHPRGGYVVVDGNYTVAGNFNISGYLYVVGSISSTSENTHVIDGQLVADEINLAGTTKFTGESVVIAKSYAKFINMDFDYVRNANNAKGPRFYVPADGSMEADSLNRLAESPLPLSIGKFTSGALTSAQFDYFQNKSTWETAWNTLLEGTDSERDLGENSNLQGLSEGESLITGVPENLDATILSNINVLQPDSGYSISVKQDSTIISVGSDVVIVMGPGENPVSKAYASLDAAIAGLDSVANKKAGTYHFYIAGNTTVTSDLTIPSYVTCANIYNSINGVKAIDLNGHTLTSSDMINVLDVAFVSTGSAGTVKSTSPYTGIAIWGNSFENRDVAEADKYKVTNNVNLVTTSGDITICGNRNIGAAEPDAFIFCGNISAGNKLTIQSSVQVQGEVNAKTLRLKKYDAEGASNEPIEGDISIDTANISTEIINVYNNEAAATDNRLVIGTLNMPNGTLHTSEKTYTVVTGDANIKTTNNDGYLYVAGTATIQEFNNNPHAMFAAGRINQTASRLRASSDSITVVVGSDETLSVLKSLETQKINRPSPEETAELPLIILPSVIVDGNPAVVPVSINAINVNSTAFAVAINNSALKTNVYDYFTLRDETGAVVDLKSKLAQYGQIPVNSVIVKNLSTKIADIANKGKVKNPAPAVDGGLYQDGTNLIVPVVGVEVRAYDTQIGYGDAPRDITDISSTSNYQFVTLTDAIKAIGNVAGGKNAAYVFTVYRDSVLDASYTLPAYVKEAHFVSGDPANTYALDLNGYTLSTSATINAFHKGINLVSSKANGTVKTSASNVIEGLSAYDRILYCSIDVRDNVGSNVILQAENNCSVALANIANTAKGETVSDAIMSFDGSIKAFDTRVRGAWNINKIETKHMVFSDNAYSGEAIATNKETVVNELIVTNEFGNTSNFDTDKRSVKINKITMNGGLFWSCEDSKTTVVNGTIKDIFLEANTYTDGAPRIATSKLFLTGTVQQTGKINAMNGAQLYALGNVTLNNLAIHKDYDFIKSGVTYSVDEVEPALRIYIPVNGQNLFINGAINNPQNKNYTGFDNGVGDNLGNIIFAQLNGAEEVVNFTRSTKLFTTTIDKLDTSMIRTEFNASVEQPTDEYNSVYQQNKGIWVGNASITLKILDVSGNYIELKSFDLWSDAAAYINTLSNEKANYLVELSENVDCERELALPNKAQSIRFKNVSGGADNIVLRYVGSLAINTNVTFEGIDLRAEVYDGATKTYIDNSGRTSLNINGKTLELIDSTAFFNNISGGGTSKLVIKNTAALPADLSLITDSYNASDKSTYTSNDFTVKVYGNINVPNVELTNAAVKTTGETSANTDFAINGSVVVAKGVNANGTLTLDKAIIDSTGRVNIKNIVSNSDDNHIIYPADVNVNNTTNKVTNVNPWLTVSGTVTTTKDALAGDQRMAFQADGSALVVADPALPSNASIRKAAIDIRINNSRATDPAFESTVVDYTNVRATAATLVGNPGKYYTEGINTKLLTANVAEAAWFVVGGDYSSSRASVAQLTSKMDTGIYSYGTSLKNVTLSTVDENGDPIAVVGQYATMKDAFNDINRINNQNAAYRVEISLANAPASIDDPDYIDYLKEELAVMGGKLNVVNGVEDVNDIRCSGVDFPNKLTKLYIASDDIFTMFYSGNLSLRSNLDIDGIMLCPKPSYDKSKGEFKAVTGNINLDKYTLDMFEVAMNDDYNVSIGEISGNGINNTSTLNIIGCDPITMKKINNVGKVSVSNITGDTGTALAPSILLTDGMNVGTLILDGYQIVEVRNNTTINNVVADGDTLVATANVEIKKNSDNQEVISKLNPQLTINGTVSGNLELEITRKTQDSVDRSLYYYDPISLDDPNEVMEDLVESGAWLAKANMVSTDTITLSSSNCNPEDSGLIVKTNGYIAYRHCDENVHLIYTDDNGEEVTSIFATLEDAVTEINNIRPARDYVIELTDEATKVVYTEKDGNNVTVGALKEQKDFKMPNADRVKSLTIRPMEGAGSVDVYYRNNITFNSDTTLEDISFVKVERASDGSYKPSDEAKADYPAAVNVSAGSHVLTISGNVEFNTPLNLSGGGRGTLVFDEHAMLFTYENGVGPASNGISEVFGQVSDFADIKITDSLSVRKYRTSATSDYTGGTLKGTNIQVADPYGYGIVEVVVEGNYEATNTTVDAGNIYIVDVYDSLKNRFTGSRAQFNNLTITGNDVYDEEIRIEADREFNINGTLTCTYGNVVLSTRQRFDNNIKNRTPFLRINGTVLVDNIGTGSAIDADTFDLGNRIGVEVRYSNELWNTDYAEFKNIVAEVDQYDTVDLTGAPNNTALLVTTSKGVANQFKLADTHIVSSPYSVIDDMVPGYILKKTSDKIHVYQTDEIAVAVVRNDGYNGVLEAVDPSNVLGYFPTLKDAVTYVNELRDKTADYTFILLQDIGTYDAPVSFELPSEAKSVTMVSYSTMDENDEAVCEEVRHIYHSNGISLRTNTILETLDLDPIRYDRGRDTAYGTKQSISAGAYDLTLAYVTVGESEEIEQSDNNGGDSNVATIREITGNGKNTLEVLNDTSCPLVIYNAINNFGELYVAGSSEIYVGDASENNRGELNNIAKLTYEEDGYVCVGKTVNITDVYNEDDTYSGTLEYAKNNDNRQVNMTIKGDIHNAGEPFNLVMDLGKVKSGRYTTPETREDVELQFQKDNKGNNMNRVVVNDKFAIATMEKVSLEKVHITIVEDGEAIDTVYDAIVQENLVKINKKAYLMSEDVAGNAVTLSYEIAEGVDESGDDIYVEYNTRFIDLRQASQEIDNLNSSTTSYTITLPDGYISDTNMVDDNDLVSEFKLPGGGKAWDLTIRAESDAVVTYRGDINYNGQLTLENITLNPSAVSGGVVVPANAGINVNSVNIRVGNTNVPRSGLYLKDVGLAFDYEVPEFFEKGNVGDFTNPRGLITRISAGNGDVYADGCQLIVKETVNNIKDLHLINSELMVGRDANIKNIYTDSFAWMVFIGNTNLETIHLGDETDTLIATVYQAANRNPKVTLTKNVIRTPGSKSVVSVSLLEEKDEYISPTGKPVDTSLASVLCDTAWPVEADMLEEANLLTAKLEAAEMFAWADDSVDEPSMKVYKDMNGRIKLTGETMPVVIKKLDSDGSPISTTKAMCYYDAVKIIDNIGDNTAEYRITLNPELTEAGYEVRTGERKTEVVRDSLGSREVTAVRYAGFTTPSRAKKITIEGGAGETLLRYTGSLNLNCSTAFENIIFDEGEADAYNWKKSKGSITLSTGDRDVSFDANCSYVPVESDAGKYFCIQADNTRIEPTLVFKNINTGAANATSAGFTVDGQNVYCIGDINVKNATLTGGALLTAAGRIAINNSLFLGDATESVLRPGINKQIVLNNIYGANGATIDLYSYLNKQADLTRSATQLNINGYIEPITSGNFTVNIRPLKYTGTADLWTEISAGDHDMTALTVVKPISNNSRPAAYQKIANVPKAQVQNIKVQEYDYSMNTWRPYETYYMNVNGWAATDDVITNVKYDRGLYVSTIHSGITVKGYSDSDYTNKIYESNYQSWADAVTDINNIDNRNAYYQIILDDNLGFETVDGQKYFKAIDGLRMPEKAKEVWVKSNIDDEPVLIYFTGDVNINCNTILDRVVLVGANNTNRLASLESKDYRMYSVSLNRYELVENNTPGYITVTGLGPIQSVTKDVYQSGHRNQISGGGDAVYALMYDADPAGNYLKDVANRITGVGRVEFDNDIPYAKGSHSDHVALTFNVKEQISGLKELALSDPQQYTKDEVPEFDSENSHLVVNAGTEVSVRNLTMDHAQLYANKNINISEYAYIEYSYVQGMNIAVNKITYLSEAYLKAKTPNQGDGRIKLQDVVVCTPNNTFDVKQDKAGKSMLEINGTVTTSLPSTVELIDVGIRYCDDSGYVQLSDGMMIMKARKVSAGWFKQMPSVMGPDLATNGRGFYKSGDYIYAGPEGSIDNAEVLLIADSEATRQETYFATFEDAVKEINALEMYVDPTARDKKYVNYEIELLKDVEIGNTNKNGAYSALDLPNKTSGVVIKSAITDDGGNIIPAKIMYSGNFNARSNLVLKDIELMPMRAVNGKGELTTGDISVGDYAVEFDNVKASIRNITGGGKGSLYIHSAESVVPNEDSECETYELVAEQIGSMGRLIIGTNSYLNVTKNANITDLVFDGYELYDESYNALCAASTLGVGERLNITQITKLNSYATNGEEAGAAIIEKGDKTVIQINGRTTRVNNVNVNTSVEFGENVYCTHEDPTVMDMVCHDAFIMIKNTGNNAYIVGTQILTDKFINKDNYSVWSTNAEDELVEYSTFVNGQNLYTGTVIEQD